LQNEKKRWHEEHEGKQRNILSIRPTLLRGFSFVFFVFFVVQSLDFRNSKKQGR